LRYENLSEGVVLRISKKAILGIALFFMALVVIVYLSLFLGIRFTDNRFIAGSRFILLILPWVCIFTAFSYGAKWLKIIAILGAVPQGLITIGLLYFSTLNIDLPTLLTGKDPDTVLIEKKKIGSKYRCAYDMNICVGDPVEEYRYETPILPGIVKIDHIDDIKTDSDKWSIKMDGMYPSYEKLDPAIRSSQNENVLEGVPDNKTFGPLLIHVLTSCFEDDRFKDLQFKYTFLADHPFQSGIAFPKYYLWVEKYDGSHPIGRGVIEVAAIDQTRLGVVEFVSKKDLATDLEWIKRHYPPEVCKSILQKIEAK
jgi:hypothetical protein